MAIYPEPGAELLPPEPNPPKPWWVRPLRIVIALVAVGGMLWLSGLYQQTFVRRTADTARPLVTASPLAENFIEIPLRVFIVTNSEGEGSSRTRTDVERLVERATDIWEQAGIKFILSPTEIETVELSASEIRRLNHSPRETIPVTLPNWSPQMVNVVLVRAIPEGVNGFAMEDINTTLVADFTSVFDFRTLAHEIGHILSLDHVDDPQRLMFSGSNGLSFSNEEVSQARQATNKLSR